MLDRKRNGHLRLMMTGRAMAKPVGIRKRAPGFNTMSSGTNPCRPHPAIHAQRQILAIGQPHDPQRCHADSCFASCAIKRCATSCFDRSPQLSTPDAETSCTVFLSPPKTPRSLLTSLATMRSQPFFFSLSRALSTRFSVSAAKPTTALAGSTPAWRWFAGCRDFPPVAAKVCRSCLS